MALLAVACALLVPALSAAQSPSPTSSLLVKLVEGLGAEAQADVIARDGGIERSVIPVLRLHVIEVPPSDFATVRANYQADPQVVSVEENRTRVSETVPGDPLYPNQWALPQIGWDQVFGTVAPAGTATVALLDTGVDALHPDLAGKVVPGTSILDGSNGMTDPSGHGTWLAGIIAAQTDNVPVEGIAGVAYAGVTVIPVTVLNANGEGQDSDVIAGAAALMKAVDPTLTNGIIVGRLARNADPAGTQSQTGNGRINLLRALADTSTEFIQPAGAAPVGNGGPFVGPYVAAAELISGT